MDNVGVILLLSLQNNHTLVIKGKTTAINIHIDLK